MLLVEGRMREPGLDYPNWSKETKGFEIDSAVALKLSYYSTYYLILTRHEIEEKQAGNLHINLQLGQAHLSDQITLSNPVITALLLPYYSHRIYD